MAQVQPPASGPHNVVVTQPGPATGVVPQPHQRDWMVPAILTCFCCFWPTGIVAILFAYKAKQAASSGDVLEAEVQTKRARLFVFISLAVGIVLITIIVIIRATAPSQ
ncbi:proline-rich transmembrane protein 1-like [Saccostrea echinata]|uniref:proline-rich transmembrane protein 1-like n=1 Tax=Saccostrea echinata TaxID=191078 RepID=UPI002A81F661|nr:proline-rich transmembrane protein 1-like [Saccostrea echinata]